MNQMHEIQVQCSREWSRLRDLWEATHVAWKDEVAERFRKRFVVPWENEIPGYLHALEKFGSELEACRRLLR